MPERKSSPAPRQPGGQRSVPPVAPKQRLLNPEDVRRVRPRVEEEDTEDDDQLQDPTPQMVAQGPVDKVIDLAFNPTRDKIREVTVIDRMQGRLFPQLDMINRLRHYCIEVAQYRLDAKAYRKMYKRTRPVQPDALDEYLFRIAQWQKSVAGKNLERATDIALAETEARAGEIDSGTASADNIWKE